MNKLSSIAPKAAWYIPGRPILTLRRLVSLFYFRAKRAAGRDYSFTPPQSSDVPIDIFMPTVEKDAAMLELSLTYARQNIKHPIGTIYLVAPDSASSIKSIAKKHDCVFVAEDSIIPLKKDAINYYAEGYNRNGWIYKMLLNLAADTICQNRYILILDSDTCFIAPQIFLYQDRPLFNLSTEYNQPYFDANQRLLNIPHRPSRSFITHYMLFDAEVLKKLRAAIEQKWHKHWYDAIVAIIDKTELSGFADYEVYGDFYMATVPKRPILNYWSNESLTVDSIATLEQIIEAARPYFRSVSLHNYSATLMNQPHQRSKSK